MRIFIIGCGWVGLPLGRALAAAGHIVTGTTRRSAQFSELEKAGILPVMWDASGGDYSALLPFLDADAVVVTLPPSRQQPADTYAQTIGKIGQLAMQSGCAQVIFTSSTGVYPDLSGLYLERSDTTDTPSRLAEIALRDYCPNGCILRLGGLCGGDRWPGRYFSGRTDIPGGNSTVNLVHLTDVIGVITACIVQRRVGITLNVCAGQHPTRREVYTHQCRLLDLPLPHFTDDGSVTKIVINDASCRLLGYQYRHSDPLKF